MQICRKCWRTAEDGKTLFHTVKGCDGRILQSSPPPPKPKRKPREGGAPWSPTPERQRQFDFPEDSNERMKR